MKHTSDGSTASYYELPEGATELQHLISHRNMNAQDGEIFRAIYRKGMASHSDELRDAKKVLFYAQAEVERLEKLQKKPVIRELYTEADENRMDVVGQNGNTAEHYPSDDWIPANGKEPDLPPGTLVDVKLAGGFVATGCPPHRWMWTQDGDAEDITHYRVVEALEQ